ncbi:MAG: IMPACT family protein [Clostridiales bacterium]
MIEEFNTVEAFSETKFKEKGSVFIGQVFPALNEEQALEILEQARKKFYDATHHCYAYCFSDIVKYSDDGEPSGTAGLRIYNAIQHFQLNNVILIVIRYFGGTKLGVGPLGKAYYNSAFQTIESAKILTKKSYLKFTIEFDFNQTSQIHYILSKLGARILKTDYENHIVITFLLRPSDKDKMEAFLEESLNNRAQMKDTGELYFI